MKDWEKEALYCKITQAIDNFYIIVKDDPTRLGYEKEKMKIRIFELLEEAK